MLKSSRRAPKLWRALSSPVRRRILDRLRDGPRTTSELAASFPKLSRFAVMQHLAVLVDARLVLIRREGRFRFNYLNAVPLVQVYERWVSTYAAPMAHGALALKSFLERSATEGNEPVTGTRRQFAYVIRPPRATFTNDATDQERAIVGEHFRYLQRLRDAGTVVLAGRCDDGEFGIVIYEADDESAGRRLMEEDPAVRAGLFKATFHPFRSALLRDESRAAEARA